MKGLLQRVRGARVEVAVFAVMVRLFQITPSATTGRVLLVSGWTFFMFGELLAPLYLHWLLAGQYRRTGEQLADGYRH